MTPLSSAFTFFVSLGVLFTDILILFMIGLFISEYFSGKQNLIIRGFINTYALTFAFLVSFGATLGSLFYSAVIHFVPCELCWYQRIFLFPQVFLFAAALYKRDRGIFRYSLILSSIGGLIAAYHYIGQMFSSSLLPCDATGAASCAQRPFVEFGYVTIPMMGLTAFLLLITIAYIARSTKE